MGVLIRIAIAAGLLHLGMAHAEILDRVLVIVEDDVITSKEFEQRLNIISEQVRRSNTPLPPLSQLQAQVLDHMVVLRLQKQQAARLGIAVHAGELQRELETLAQRNNMTLAQFRAEVERTNIHFYAFADFIYEEMLTQRLQQAESRRLVRVTDEEIENFLRLHSDQLQSEARYHLAHILITLPQNATAAQARRAEAKAIALRQRVLAGEHFASLAIAESDGRAALEGGDLGWRDAAALPEIASRVIPEMASGEVSEVLKNTSGFHLFHLIAMESVGQIMVNQTQVRHILIRTHAMMDNDEAQTRLKDLTRRIKFGGENFADLARSHSDDTASAVDGGALGWRSPGELDPYFEEQMARQAVGDISEPFQTNFGWHILQVQDRREVDETEQTLRQRALNHLARSRVSTEVEIWLRRLLEDAYVHYVNSPGDA